MDPSSLNAKRQRLVQHLILEEAVSLWVLQCQHRGVIITGDIICAKDHRLAQLLGTPDDAITFSHGWLHKFQQHHMLRAINIYRESGSVDVEAMSKALPDVKKPMDAGVIAAFKRRYRRYHLQNAIDCDERREGFNIYKVDQLTAMCWSVAAWNEISSTTIANCFSHTGIFSTESVISSAVEVEGVKMAQRRSRRKKVSWRKS
uniref:HTH CENPB-type domain-containing protein n=1 Tax=Hyaloperonospora arabidopsidis (strain Emoy2) TaxID=559515 RepID=M4B1X8_HYAAE